MVGDHGETPDHQGDIQDQTELEGDDEGVSPDAFVHDLDSENLAVYQDH